MREYAIAVIPGDGIGNEVVPEAVRVLDAAGEISASCRLRYESFPGAASTA
jgi:tartrate dehydrogenase/decarboxylase/D-malate dehydrogenase